MSDLLPYLFFLGVVVLGVAVVFLVFWMEKKKREAMERLAAALSLTYRPDKDRALADQFSYLGLLNQGSNRYAAHVFRGGLDGFPILVFEHHHETYSTDSKGRQTTHHHYASVYVTDLPVSCPEVTIRPEGIFSKIAQAFGYADIDFESAEFSRKFCVRSADKRFAYDICSPAAIEYLLAQPRAGSLELEGRTLALIDENALSSTLIEARLRMLLGFRKLFPRHLLSQPAQGQP